MARQVYSSTPEVGCSGKVTCCADGEIGGTDGEVGVFVRVPDDSSRFFRLPAGDFLGFLV